MTKLIEPRKKPLQSRSKYMVNTILSGAAQVLQTHGYAGTNTNLIAAHTGVSVGSIYQYFPNKEAIIAALYAQHEQAMLTVLKEGLPRGKKRPLHDLMAHLINAILDAYALAPKLRRVLVRECKAHLQIDDEPVSSAIAQYMKMALRKCENEISIDSKKEAVWTVQTLLVALAEAFTAEPKAWMKRTLMEEHMIRAAMGYLTCVERC